MKKRVLFLVVIGISVMMGAIQASGQELDIQKLIDRAAPGDVIPVPAGTYRVNLILKEGVILEGAGGGLSVLDGGGIGPVIVGEAGSVVKGFTITKGIEGVKLSGRLMGVFENIITGNIGSGIRSGGGDCVIINNIISGNLGPAGIDTARSYVLAVNNTICGGQSGLLFWKSTRSKVANNVVGFSEVGATRDEESAPDIFNNIFWGNGEDFLPEPPEGENLFQDPELLMEVGVCRLQEDSPAAILGVPIAGLPEELTAGIGVSPVSFSLPIYLGIMETAAARALGWKPLVEYELLEEIGSFSVTTSFVHPDFTVGSSTASTSIEEIKAFDRESLDTLIERLVTDEPPSVEVRSWGGINYPREKDRYVMDSVFIKPESYYSDQAGRLHFVRKTSFARIKVAIPEGYAVESLAPEGEIYIEEGVISILNPVQALIEINLVLSPN